MDEEEMHIGALKKLLKGSLVLSGWLEDHGASFMRDCRGSRGVREFARMLKVSPTLVSRIEHGKVKMGRPTLGVLLLERARC